MGDRLIQQPFLSQNHAKVVMGHGKVRFNFHSLLIVADCLIHLPHLQQDIAEVIMRFGRTRINFHSFLKVLQRLVHLNLFAEERCRGCYGGDEVGDFSKVFLK